MLERSTAKHRIWVLAKTPETYVWLVILLPVVHALLIYPGLPEEIPTHFSSSGPGRYREKSLFYFIILPLTNVGVYYLIRYFSQQLDQQQKIINRQSFYFFRLSLAACLSMLALLINHQRSHPDAALENERWMLSGVAIILGFMTYLIACSAPSSINLYLTEAERHPELWKRIRAIMKKWIPICTLLVLFLVWVLHIQVAIINFCIYTLLLLLSPILLMYSLSKQYR